MENCMKVAWEAKTFPDYKAAVCTWQQSCFSNMKQYENVGLKLNSKAIADSKPDCMEGSLYEAVEKHKSFMWMYVSSSYLGHIIEC